MLSETWLGMKCYWILVLYNHLLCHVDDDLHALQRDSKHSAQPSNSGRLLWQWRSLVLAYSWRYLGPQISRIFDIQTHICPNFFKYIVSVSDPLSAQKTYQKTSLLKPHFFHLRPSTFFAVVAPAWWLVPLGQCPEGSSLAEVSAGLVPECRGTGDGRITKSTKCVSQNEVLVSSGDSEIFWSPEAHCDGAGGSGPFDTLNMNFQAQLSNHNPT